MAPKSVKGKGVARNAGAVEPPESALVVQRTQTAYFPLTVGAPKLREMFRKCFDAGLLIRVTGDILAFSPPLIVEKNQIDQIVDTVRKTLQEIE